MSTLSRNTAPTVAQAATIGMLRKSERHVRSGERYVVDRREYLDLAIV